MKKSTNTITSLPASPDDNRRRRMIEYTIMMSTRVLCLIACVVMVSFGLPFWTIVIPVIGAVFLPYFAVVSANAIPRVRASKVERPGAIERHRDEK